jgi:hypothetical protein
VCLRYKTVFEFNCSKRLKVGEIVRTRLLQFGVLLFNTLLSDLSGPALGHDGSPDAGGWCLHLEFIPQKSNRLVEIQTKFFEQMVAEHSLLASAV